MGTLNLNALVYKSAAINRELGGKTGFEGSAPPQWLLDKMAEEKLSGGFNLRKKNLCNGCWQYRSSNGTCGCED